MTAKSRWVSIPSGGRTTVLCFPFAGGGASFYRGWNALVPSSLALAAVQLPGREERFTEPCFDRMDSLVVAATDALVPLLPSSYAFFGHSMGGMIAFELIRELMRRGAPLPTHLFVSATPAPHLSATIPVIYDLPHDEFLRELRRYQGLPEEVLEHAELLELLLPRLRADLAVTGTYAYAVGPPLTIPITAFSGRDDDIVASSTIDAWREHTLKEFRHATFPGSHFFLSQRVPEVVSILEQALR